MAELTDTSKMTKDVAVKASARVNPPQKVENLRVIEIVPKPSDKPVNTPPAQKKKNKSWIRRIRKVKLRYTILAASFLCCVLVPGTIASVYLAFVAADQYHSSASFSIRSIDAPQASDLLGMFTQSGGSGTITDSYVLLDFIKSERMVREVDAMVSLEKIFASRGGDFYYGIGQNLPIEKKIAYWRKMVRVDFDHSTGIMNLEVKTFNPEDSKKIANFIIVQSEKLINELSDSARNEVLKLSRAEVQVSQLRLQEARIALRDYRDVSQEADPREGAKLAAELIANLERKLAQLNVELSSVLTRMSEDTPRVRIIRTQIGSIEKQIEAEKQRIGAGTNSKQGRTSTGQDVASRMQEYETLQTEREFAERAYTSSLASLEKARVEADAKQRYLAVFINPSVSELAQYPQRLFDSFLIFLGAFFAWGVVVMTYYNIRDRH